MLRIMRRALVLFFSLVIMLLAVAFVLKNPGAAPVHHTGLGDQCIHDCRNSSLVCKAGTCSLCVSNIDCSLRHPSTECREGLCVHQTPYESFWVDLLVSILVSFAVVLAAGSGVGGGGLIVSILILVGGFNAHSSIPLSKSAIFGASISSVMFFLTRRHPTCDRPRIDYDITLMMEPMAMIGTTIGVLLNHLAPEWLLLMALIFLLGLVTYRMALKGLELWRLEGEKGDDEKGSLIQSSYAYYVVPASQKNSADLTVDDRRELDEILANESAIFPMKKILVLVGLSAVMIFTELVRGGWAASGWVQCGSRLYWFFFLILFPIGISITFYVGENLVRLHKKKVELLYPFQPGDPLWTVHNTTLFPALSMGGGILAALLGVGGGMITGPLLLEIGTLPQVQVATTTFMVLFTSGSGLAQYWILGDLRTDYALIFILIGFFSSIFGQLVFEKVVIRLKRTSILVLSLAFVLGLSVLMIGYVGVQGVRRNYDETHDTFRTLCH